MQEKRALCFNQGIFLNVGFVPLHLSFRTLYLYSYALSIVDRHNISARLGSSKEDLGSDLKDLPLGKANTSQFGPTSNVGTCNDVVDIEKRLGDVHKLHRGKELSVAVAMCVYKNPHISNCCILLSRSHPAT